MRFCVSIACHRDRRFGIEVADRAKTILSFWGERYRVEGKHNGTMKTDQGPTLGEVTDGPTQRNDEQRSEGCRQDEARNAKNAATVRHIGFPHSGHTPDSLPVRL